MAQRDMKKILRFTSHKEMQIKATVRFPLPSMKMIIIQKSVTASEDVGKVAPSPLWVAMYSTAAIMQYSTDFSVT